MSPEPAARSAPLLDLSSPRHVHVVAAGGAGMSGIATVLVERGHRVTGSDLADGAALRRLRDLGARVVVGHDTGLVAGADAVVVSTAVPTDDPEVLEAARLGIPVLTRTDMLPSFAAVQPLVSISGTHGKTTTTSMVAAALRGAGEDPSFLVGAEVRSLGAAAASGDGRWFVLEADESDGSFMAGPRAAAVVTNVEPDHLEFWGSWEALLEGFRRFLDGTDGPRVVCADDRSAAQVGSSVGATTYGRSPEATHRIERLHLGPAGSTFRVVTPHSASPVDVALAVPGLHNALNAAGALAVVAELGVDPDDAAAALGTYAGVSRRFEPRGDAAGVHFVDDYAHLPTEVRAALAAGRSGGWGRVVAVFQPHRYSRTQALWSEFATAFADADLVVLTDVFAAGEAPREGVDGTLLVDAVRTAGGRAPVVWAPTLADVADVLVSELRDGDLCLTMGAGDVTTVADRVLQRLRSAGEG